MIPLLKRLFCKHKYDVFQRNIYGDPIIWHGWKRSVWTCSKCGKQKYEDDLYYDPNDPKLPHP